MTKQELNRDIKRLWSQWQKALQFGGNDYYDILEKNIKPEFKRLYNADNSAQYLNIQSLKIMQRMNQSLVIVPFHVFYINIEI